MKDLVYSTCTKGVKYEMMDHKYHRHEEGDAQESKITQFLSKLPIRREFWDRDRVSADSAVFLLNLISITGDS